MVLWGSLDNPRLPPRFPHLQQAPLQVVRQRRSRRIHAPRFEHYPRKSVLEFCRTCYTLFSPLSSVPVVISGGRITTKLSRGQAAQRVGRRLERLVRRPTDHCAKHSLQPQGVGAHLAELMSSGVPQARKNNGLSVAPTTYVFRIFGEPLPF